MYKKEKNWWIEQSEMRKRFCLRLVDIKTKCEGEKTDGKVSIYIGRTKEF